MIEKKRKEKKTHSERNDWHIRSPHPVTKDTTMNKTIIHPPRGSFLMFVIGTSREINQWWHQVSWGVSMPCLVLETSQMTYLWFPNKKIHWMKPTGLSKKLFKIILVVCSALNNQIKVHRSIHLTTKSMYDEQPAKQTSHYNELNVWSLKFWLTNSL